MRKSERSVKELIIKTAQEIFVRYGFKKTTMDEIAKAVCKAKSSIYYYFKSKEEIFYAILEKESKILKSELTKAVKQQDTPQKKLYAYVITRMRCLRNLINFYNALKDEYLTRYSFIKKLKLKQYKEELKMIKEILKKGVECGSLVLEDLEMTSQSILIALNGLEFSWVMHKSDIPKTEKHIENLLNILFYGIGKNKI